MKERATGSAVAPVTRSRAALLKHPLVILLSIVLGVFLGVYEKGLAQALAPLGELYLFFIQMTVYPILVSAIVSGLARLIQAHSAGGNLLRMALIFMVCMLTVGIFGLATGLLGEPGLSLDEQARHVLGKIINQSERNVLEISLSDPSGDQMERQIDLWGFLRMLVPPNIFQSLYLGRALQIVFFSIIFGIALGNIRSSASDLIINLLLSALEACQQLIAWSLYGLPFALVCLIATQVASVGVELFAAMLKFTLLFWLVGGVLFLVSTVLIWLRSGIRNPLHVLRALCDPIMISFATRSSFAALPASINAMQEDLGFERETVSLMLPLGITISRYGNIVYFALASLFVIQLYGQPLSASALVIVVLGSVFAGMATAGSSGILTLGMISIVLTPLGLPVEAVLIVMIAVDAVIDPMRTFLIVYINIAATALIARRPAVLREGAPVVVSQTPTAPTCMVDLSGAQRVTS
ncbi:MAG: dicarboxylate/amino acid:cation symporter [Candidatus Tectimicrobiota bacterium]